ncbi:hypothetical protein [Rhodococcus koreensis]|uniref:hypothetical protein n=1 Tax=Rhodococcus koreensis TaxID=99653 RepID=UPI0036D7E933
MGWDQSRGEAARPIRDDVRDYVVDCLGDLRRRNLAGSLLDVRGPAGRIRSIAAAQV